MKDIEAWKSFEGQVYGMPDIKIPHVMPLLRSLDYQADDPVLIDVGSGYPSVSEQTRLGGPRRFSVANIDAAIGDRRSARVWDIPVDIEELTHDEAPFAYNALRTFLSEQSESGLPLADGIVYSEILNYVDFRHTIRWFDQLLKVGGFIVVANMPGRGIERLFSEQGVQSNPELVDFCQNDRGYAIETLLHPVPETGISPDTDFLLAAFQKTAQ